MRQSPGIPHVQKIHEFYKKLEEISRVAENSADPQQAGADCQTNLANFKENLSGLKESLIKESKRTSVLYTMDRKRSANDLLAQLENRWRFFAEWTIPRLEEVHPTLPGKARVKTVQEKINNMMNHIKNTADFYVRYRCEVKRSLGTVQNFVDKSESGLGRIDRGADGIWEPHEDACRYDRLNPRTEKR